MLSTCVLFQPEFHNQIWSPEEFNSLCLLYFKFDLYVMNCPDELQITDNWLTSQLKLRRVVAHLNADARAENFQCLEKQNVEWAGNVDVYVNFSEAHRLQISRFFPHRTFLTLKDVLNPDFVPEIF